MAVKYARPDVARLVYQVFARSIHPELLTVFETRTFTLPFGELQVDVLDAGHVLSLRLPQQTLTEIVVTGETPLPQKYRLLSQRLSGHREGQVTSGNVHFVSSSDVEFLDEELFAHHQAELQIDSLYAPIQHAFSGGHRFAPSALSYLQIEAQQQSLQIHAFHTFPKNLAIVKSQSRFELIPQPTAQAK